MTNPEPSPQPTAGRHSGHAAEPQSRRAARRRSVESERDVNGWAVAALICAFIHPISGIILSVAALQSAHRDGCGRTMAVTALLIGLILLVGQMAGIILNLNTYSTGDTGLLDMILGVVDELLPISISTGF